MLSDCVRVDRAVLRIDREQHRAAEAVAAGQDLAELRQSLLGAVLLVAGDQHNVLAIAGPGDTVVHDPGIGWEDGAKTQTATITKITITSV